MWVFKSNGPWQRLMGIGGRRNQHYTHNNTHKNNNNNNNNTHNFGVTKFIMEFAKYLFL